MMYNNNYTTMDKKDLHIILEEIGLSPAEISVYISLLDGAESVKEIIRLTLEKRPTVYYSLSSLEKKGLVSKTGKDYGNKYQIEPVDKITELVDKNIRKQNNLLERAKKIKDFYPKIKNDNKVIVSYFDNFESIKSAIFFSLYAKNKTIKTIVPGSNFFNESGTEFIKEYVKEKTKKKIKTKAIWEDVPTKRILNEYYANSDIRQLPTEMHNQFETTIFIYDDYTLYIAPKKENFAFLVKSNEHAKMMSTLFSNIWNSSFVLDKKI